MKKTSLKYSPTLFNWTTELQRVLLNYLLSWTLLQQHGNPHCAANGCSRSHDLHPATGIGADNEQHKVVALTELDFSFISIWIIPS